MRKIYRDYKSTVRAKLLLLLLLGVFSSFNAHAFTLNATIAWQGGCRNRLIIGWSNAHNACFIPLGNIMRIYVNDVHVFTHAMSHPGGLEGIYAHNISGYRPGVAIRVKAEMQHNGFACNYYVTRTTYVVAPEDQPMNNIRATQNAFGDRIVVSWNRRSYICYNQLHYRIYRGITLLATVPGDQTSFSHSGLSQGLTIRYFVRAVANGVHLHAPNEHIVEGRTFRLDLRASTDQTNSILFTWNSLATLQEATGYRLYFRNAAGDWQNITSGGRNETSIAITSPHITIPGFSHHFRLVVTGTSGVYAETTGMLRPNGVISGHIRTPFPGLVPVSGVRVRAVLVGPALPNNPTTTYEAVTGADGSFRFNNMYYHEEATFELTPELDNRVFSPANQNVTLRIGQNVREGVNFTDMSSFAITGNISNAYCPVPGVHLVIGNDTLGVTNASGNYFITVSTGGSYTITPRLKGHLFDPPHRTLNVSGNLANINFTETAHYIVRGKIQASCDVSIGSGTLRFYSADASRCFDKTVITDANGYFSVRLPLQPYYVALSSFTSHNPRVNAHDVRAFFFEPRKLDFRSLDSDLIPGDTITFNLTYRMPPTLLMSPLGYITTCDPDSIPLVRRHVPVKIEFQAMDEFLGNFCPTGDGFIIIEENVSSIGMGINIDTLHYKRGERIQYTLNPGTPNLIAAQGHRKFFRAILVRDGQRDTIYTPVIVLGGSPREQNFTTVSPSIPFHILHDPPGDGSYSFLNKEQALTTAFTQSVLQEGTVDKFVRAQLGFAASVETGFIVGASIEKSYQLDITASLGLGSSGLTEWASVFTTTLSDYFQTSGNPNVIGASGDVYIGGALNLLYGITDILTYDFQACTLQRSKALHMQPSGIASTFMYTESHITDVIMPELRMIYTYLNSRGRRDSAAFYLDQYNVWRQTVAQNHRNIRYGLPVDTIAFSGGVAFTRSLTSTRTQSKTIDHNVYIEAGVATEAGLSVGGFGIYGGVAVRGRITTGNVIFEEVVRTNTVGFHLSDDDIGDEYLIEVLTDRIYGTPAFRIISGQTSCPHVPGTVPREGVQLTANTTTQSVEETQAAVFVLQLANTSQSNEERTYDLVFDHTTNPGGAVITIGGSPIVGDIPFSYTIPAWGSQNATITVRRGPTDRHYQGLKFTLRSQCDDSIYDHEFLNVFFHRLFNLDLRVVGSGTTTPALGTHSHAEGSIVTLTATPNPGNAFHKWVVGTTEYFTETIQFAMVGNKTATAHFTAPTYIGEPQQAEVVRVFPNPTQGNVNIESKVPLNKISLYDPMGMRVYEAIVENINSHRIDIHHLQPGIYILRLMSENNMLQFRIIKM